MFCLVSSNVNSGWIVTFAAVGANCAIGVLYSWSVIAEYLRGNLNWSATQSQIPFMIAAGIFSLMMILGGYIQDKIGPRFVIMVGGIFTGIAFVSSSFFITVIGLSIFFGIFFGSAMGLVYSSTMPPAVKWFGPNKRGLVAGLVVSGFGAASIFIAPLAEYMINEFGISSALLVLGITFSMSIMVLAQVIENPPVGYVPAGVVPAPKIKAGDKQRDKKLANIDFKWKEMIKTPQFYILWLIYCFASLAGLMIIGHLASITLEQTGVPLGFLLVALLAVFNAGGRIAAGALSDKLGRVNTMLLVFAVQAVNFLLFNTYQAIVPLLIGTAIVGACYGACLSLFPAMSADLFGTKNLGVNYGLLFIAWGVAGVSGSLIGGLVRDMTGAYQNAYLIACGLSVLTIVLTLFVRKPPKLASLEEIAEI